MKHERTTRLLELALGGRRSSEYGAAGVHRKDRVYLTTHKMVALLFASWVSGWVIYECEPVGDLEPDPDCLMPDISWQCEKAVVIRVIKPKAKDVETDRAAMLDMPTQ